MILKIEGYHKPEAWSFFNSRFECTNSIENPTCYRWQFIDNAHTSKRFVWIELTRIGHYNHIDQEWEYRLTYPNSPIHIVTTKWFSNIGNVMETFKECLKNIN